MLAFPGMLVDAAVQAGMAVPPNPDSFDAEAFPHFHVFCEVQLGVEMSSLTNHWENAKVIADVPADRIKLISRTDLYELGYRW